jgi:hypothetical protein
MTTKNKQNRQKIISQKGGGETWIEWIKSNKTLQGPFNSSGIENFIKIMGNFFANFSASWGIWFAKKWAQYNPTIIAAQMFASISASIMSSVLDFINQNSGQLKKLQALFTMPSMPTIPLMPAINIAPSTGGKRKK